MTRSWLTSCQSQQNWSVQIQLHGWCCRSSDLTDKVRCLSLYFRTNHMCIFYLFWDILGLSIRCSLWRQTGKTGRSRDMRQTVQPASRLTAQGFGAQYLHLRFCRLDISIYFRRKWAQWGNYSGAGWKKFTRNYDGEAMRQPFIPRGQDFWRPSVKPSWWLDDW